MVRALSCDITDTCHWHVSVFVWFFCLLRNPSERGPMVSWLVPLVMEYAWYGTVGTPLEGHSVTYDSLNREHLCHFNDTEMKNQGRIYIFAVYPYWKDKHFGLKDLQTHSVNTFWSNFRFIFFTFVNISWQTFWSEGSAQTLKHWNRKQNFQK